MAGPTLAQQSSEYFNQVMNDVGNAGAAGPAQGYVPPVVQEAATAARGFHPLSYVKSYGQIPGNLAKFANPATEFGAADMAASLPAGAGSIAAFLAANPAGNALASATGNPDAGYLASHVIKDAAIGAGLASFVPGVGTLLGGAAGGAFGALQGLFHHSNTNPDEAVVKRLQGVRDQTFSSLAGVLDPQTVAAVRSQYDQYLNDSSPTQVQDAQGNVHSVSGVDAGRARAFDYLSKVQAANQPTSLPGIPDQTTTGGLSAQEMLKLQEQTTRLMSPMYDQLRKEGTSEIQAWMQAATPAGQKIDSAITNLGKVYQGSLGELTAAYKLQAQAQPFLNAVASSVYNKGITAQNAPTANGGTLASLLAGGGQGQQAQVGQPPLATNYGASPLLIQ